MNRNLLAKKHCCSDLFFFCALFLSFFLVFVFFLLFLQAGVGFCFLNIKLINVFALLRLWILLWSQLFCVIALYRTFVLITVLLLFTYIAVLGYPCLQEIFPQSFTNRQRLFFEYLPFPCKSQPRSSGCNFFFLFFFIFLFSAFSTPNLFTHKRFNFLTYFITVSVISFYSLLYVSFFMSREFFTFRSIKKNQKAGLLILHWIFR